MPTSRCCEHVGPDNIFIFGLTAEEVARSRQGGVSPRAAIDASPRLTRAFELIEAATSRPTIPAASGRCSTTSANFDHFLVTADFDSLRRSAAAGRAHLRRPGAWWPKAVLNTAHMGWFSSDRTVRDYAREIWRVPLGT